MTGVGGAYIASAEDTEGSAVNSASPAVRNPYSTRWFDQSLAIGISFPGAFTSSDFDNHGDNASLPPVHASAGNFTNLTLGATLQLGELGVAATGELQQFSLTEAGQAALTLQVGRWKALGAYGLMGGQIVVGGGARIVTLQIQQAGAGSLLTMTGLAPEAGALLMPTGAPWRIGASVRAQVLGGIFGNGTVTDSLGARRVGGLVLPTSVVQPWEAEVGVAYQLGARPLNPGWQDPHEQESPLRREIDLDRARRALLYERELAQCPGAERAALRREQAAQERALRSLEDEHLDEESQHLRAIRKARYANWPRDKVLLLASVLVTGPSPRAISVEGFLDQRLEVTGQSSTYTPRFGLEGEPLLDRALLRAGTYIEPSRYEGSSARQHFTFGSDVRLFRFDLWGLLPDDDWKLGLFVDLAPRYTNAGIGLGSWH